VGAESELRIADARAALALAAELAECVEEATFTDRIEAVGALIEAEGVIVSAVHDWVPSALEAGDPDLYRPELLGAIDRDWRDHPVMAPDLTTPGRGARLLSDFVAYRGWQRRALFNEFYRPLGMPYELSAQLAWGPAGSSCCIALHRSGRDFGPRERALLEVLAPHLSAGRVRLAARYRPRPADAAAEPEAILARRLPLTARQAEVLARLADGRTNAGIAHDLGISPHTVVRHVDHIYRKLGVQTRAAATKVALTALLGEPQAG